MKIINIAILVSAVILTGCGGGGGGSTGAVSMPTTPTTSPAKPDPGMAVIPTTPVAPTTNAPRPTGHATAPVAVAIPRTAIETIVQTPTGINNLYYQPTCVPGAVVAGWCYTDSNNNVANILEENNSIYSQGVTAFHRRIEGPFNDSSIIVPNPPRDVRTAWREGWIGNGANILIMDDFRAFGLVGNPTNPYDPRGVHGYTVGMSANQIAPGANFYGLEAAISVSADSRFSRVLTTYRQGGLRLASLTNVEITGTIPTIHVVNMSFGGEPVDFSITAAELEVAFNRRTTDPRFQDVANTANTPLSRALADAVITKAAGNNYGADSTFLIDNVRLISTRTPNTRNRVLIVGALDKFARTSTTGENSSVSSRARVANYSNIAGQFTQMQERFLVEYGGSPYAENAYLCNASSTSSCNNIQVVTENVFTQHGTSYAAPRVAGFAALVRGKFPGLNGEQTAKILLDTATTEGLACHTGSARKSTSCAKNIYGQGHVDIADALSPIGKLN